jgi:sulfate permease, SulP family
MLLVSALALAPLIGRVPLAALGGVLLVTAWRMNEWEAIGFFVRSRLKHAIVGVFVTMIATALLDLTQAILIGIAISALIYLRQSALSLAVARGPVDLEKIRAQGHELLASCPAIHVYYITGPIFFGSVHTMLEAFGRADEHHTLVVSMRGVPFVDAMGAQALRHVVEGQHRRGGDILFSGVQPAVQQMMERTGLLELLGDNALFWSADQAIMAAHQTRAAQGCTRCDATGAGCAALRAAERRQEFAPQI